MKAWISITLLACVCFFQKGDATINSWTTPSGGSGSATVAESAATGATVETVLAVSSGAVTGYTLTTAGTPFTLAAGTSGVLTLTAAGTIDYESNPTYVLVIEAVDDATTTGTATLTVSVTDATTDPTFGSTSYGICLADGTTASSSVYTIAATDPNGDALTYSIDASGNTNTDFTIAAGGVISTANALVTATTGSYSLVIKAADATLTATVSILVAVAAVCSSSATALVVSSLTILTALVVALH